MSASKHSVFITAYEYDVLNKNYIISRTCARQLKSAIEHDDEIELLLTLSELTDLIGYVAAEANHARSKRQSEDLNSICDNLEATEWKMKPPKVIATASRF